MPTPMPMPIFSALERPDEPSVLLALVGGGGCPFVVPKPVSVRWVLVVVLLLAVSRLVVCEVDLGVDVAGVVVVREPPVMESSSPGTVSQAVSLLD